MIRQLVQRKAGLARQDIGDFGQTAMKGRRYRVNLDPVAGGQQEHLGDLLALDQLAGNLASLSHGRCSSLQHRKRRAAVGQPDN
jgi:hypothetical protein